MIDAIIPSNPPTLSDDGIYVQAGQLIYSVQCSQRDAQQITTRFDKYKLVHTVLEMPDEAAVLLGFSHPDRRALYKALRSIKGIGRASALLVLDCGEVDDILRAAAARETEFFRGIPGLGATRIQAVITDLERKYRSALPAPVPTSVTVWVEARDALVHYGLSETDAELALRDATDGNPASDAETLVADVMALQG